MNTYFFNDGIQVDSMNALINKLESMKGDIDLWFASEGGGSEPIYYLINYLNSRKDDITLTITDRLCSAATVLLVEFEGKIKIGKMDFMLFHMFDRERYPLRKWAGISDDTIQKQDLELNIELAEKFRRKNILNKKQIRRFLKGEDVLLYRKEIQKLKV